MPSLLFIASMLAAAPVQGEDLTVDLMCHGRGDVSYTTNVARAEPGKPKPPAQFRTFRDPFRGVVQVRVRGGKAEALLPPEMLRNNPGRSWSPIIKFQVSESEIRGKVELGILYAPLINVNRATGDISISGSMSNFAGSCEPYDPGQRRF
ncbi:hypothetical protein [Sphingomonas sp. PB4P5]|uniref:hypothetical protein n=1 Tax=Parasphingomonas puruogangriensis TaxID=3096155 RepID=UPI002FCA0103